MSLSFTLTLKQKIIGISLFSVLLVTGALTWQASERLYNQTQSGIRSRIDSTSAAIASEIVTWQESKVMQMKGMIPFVSDATTLLPHLIQARISADFDDIYFGNAQGSMMSSRPERDDSSFDPRSRAWYQNAVSQNALVVSEPYKDPVTGEIVVTFSLPVQHNGAIIGVLGADMTLKQLQEKIVRLEVGKNTQSLLMTPQGTIIAYENTQMIMQPLSNLNRMFTPTLVSDVSTHGQLFNLEIEQQAKWLDLIQVANTHWVMGFMLDQQTELADYQSTRNLLLAISFILTLITAIFLTLLMNYLFRDLNAVSSALAEIADGEGDLTVRITPRTDDEVGKLAKNFNRFVERLQKILLQMRDIADNLNNQATHSAASAEERTQRIHMQQGEIVMVATAVTEMSAATHEIAASADKAAHEAGSAVSTCQQGHQQVEQSQNSIRKLAEEVNVATGVIDDLNTHAASISSIMMTIRSIAEQTNLLALNAAIEAARAGDQGRGFAVVADEVRMLSQRTHTSTEEIESMINQLQLSTRKAVDIMSGSSHLAETSVHDADAAGNNLVQINDVVTVINDMAAHIATAAEEQSAVTEEITRNTESIKEASNDLAQEAHDAASQAAQLSELAYQLRQEVSRFVL
ncbi:MAG: methyl-accepting chemotaxis protein [Plesiomonas sp.]|uniref:methyl-accepting chemotaxis protein n=1 Tax=Plesiomonas sp. TaxID=2486279 RepID=UPI003F3D7CE2